MSNIITCPSCKFTAPNLIGNIPSFDSFAGRQLPFVIPGGNLYQCPVCHLRFRYPRLAKTDLDALYQDANPVHWAYKAGIRNDWVLAENWLKRDIGDKILDVGCWDGHFLANLSDQWEKFGIEINKEAAERAKDAGIKIIGEDVYQSEKNLTAFFDVVTAFDVFEHMEDPAGFLSQLLDYTRTGGYIIIGTGNTEAWTWKLAKSRYWYCWNPEHISFVNRVWFEGQKEALRFKILDVQEFSHSSQRSVIGLLSQNFANSLYLFAPSFFHKMRLLRWRFLGEEEKKIVDHPPVWNMSRDHLFVVLQKANLEEKENG